MKACGIARAFVRETHSDGAGHTSSRARVAQQHAAPGLTQGARGAQEARVGFMTLDVERFGPEGPDDDIRAPEDEGVDLSGYYWRLSAPGYLDCTVWCGPLPSEEEALRDAAATYEDICSSCYATDSVAHDAEEQICSSCEEARAEAAEEAAEEATA